MQSRALSGATGTGTFCFSCDNNQGVVSILNSKTSKSLVSLIFSGLLHSPPWNTAFITITAVHVEGLQNGIAKTVFLVFKWRFSGNWGTRSLAYRLPIRDTWYSVCIVNIQAGLSLRAWPVNYTCYRWVCLIFSWCYMWNCILFVEFNHKVTILLWRTSLQVTQNSPAKVSEYLGGFLKPATKWTYASGENQLTLFCLKYGIINCNSIYHCSPCYKGLYILLTDYVKYHTIKVYLAVIQNLHVKFNLHCTKQVQPT